MERRIGSCEEGGSMTDREFVEQLARSHPDASCDYWQDFIQQAVEHLQHETYGHSPEMPAQPLRIGPDLDEAQEDDWAGWTKPKGASDV
jgi:hypothetical protein